jgi:nitroreductase
MKNLYLSLIILILLNFSYNIEVGEIINLPEPEKEGGMSLNEALNTRHSSRDFDNTKDISNEMLSQALWSCYGINRLNNYKTVPSAVAWYPLLVFVFLKDGVYRYKPEGHYLIKLLDGDHRSITGTQDYVANASANFVFIADYNKKSEMDGDDEHKTRCIYLDTGHATMALYLFASAYNMKGVTRAMVDSDAVLNLLGMNKEDYIITLTFSLGY